MHTTASLVLVLSAVLLSPGCARAGGEDPSAATATGELPACAELWTDGGILPEDYQGCTDEKDEVTAPVTFTCEDGDVLVTHDDRFFAAPGSEITEAAVDSLEYERAFTACSGGA